MPYITTARREELLNGEIPQTAGELNFCLTTVAIGYVVNKGLSYDALNDVAGAFTNANAEFYRRVTAPFEGLKMAKHGDVYFSAPTVDADSVPDERP